MATRQAQEQNMPPPAIDASDPDGSGRDASGVAPADESQEKLDVNAILAKYDK